ncbi:hypothetical protein LPJ53_000862 [Coemansia erecta]|uniref:Uncharacterized protein n=1 Tax=Coemansia erecta TaxID=147472 RepID=A0A9W7Y161_9FUNG|nr:hypothetical protein LPJ53_000862 [Coemansia erecta]
MPFVASTDNMLHKLLHDRFYSTKSPGERALLALALQQLTALQTLRQDTSQRTDDLTRAISLTESQMLRLSALFDRYLQGSTRYSADDAHMLTLLSSYLTSQEARLQGVRRELHEAEVRFAAAVTAWATGKF